MNTTHRTFYLSKSHNERPIIINIWTPAPQSVGGTFVSLLCVGICVIRVVVGVHKVSFTCNVSPEVTYGSSSPPQDETPFVISPSFRWRSFRTNYCLLFHHKRLGSTMVHGSRKKLFSFLNHVGHYSGCSAIRTILTRFTIPAIRGLRLVCRYNKN